MKNNSDLLLASLGPRLKASRLRAGLTQTELAVAANVPQALTSHIEIGRCPNFSIRVLLRLAEALKVSPGMLLSDLGEESALQEAQVQFTSKKVETFDCGVEKKFRDNPEKEKKYSKTVKQGINKLSQASEMRNAQQGKGGKP